VTHPFGDLISQHLHRKHGLSQAQLAEGILQAPTIVSAMCKGRRLSGPQARERVLAIIAWLHAQSALDTLAEANALLVAADMAPLNASYPAEAALIAAMPAAAERRAMPPAPAARNWRPSLPTPSRAA
jgi:hypothetical protein